MRAPGRLCAAVAALAALATGCGHSADESDGTTLHVYAAASLQEPFEEIGEEFESAHEGVEVQLTFAGSSTLAQQIVQGAPADVFASANPSTMDTLVEAGMESTTPVAFTSNTLMIAVPPGNPAGVTGLDSLTGEDLRLVVCAPAVPCGQAAGAVEDAAGLEFSPVSEEQSVTDVLHKVTSGEADAGLVYVTDVLRAGQRVEGIDIPPSVDAVSTYPITAVEGARHGELGQEFVELVLGERGQQILDEHGFVGR